MAGFFPPRKYGWLFIPRSLIEIRHPSGGSHVTWFSLRGFGIFHLLLPPCLLILFRQKKKKKTTYVATHAYGLLFHHTFESLFIFAKEDCLS